MTEPSYPGTAPSRPGRPAYEDSTATIPPAKLTQYLLRFRPQDDKSRLLGRIGFSIEAPAVLEAAIVTTWAMGTATLDRQDEYGDYFVLAGKSLAVPKGEQFIKSVWVRRAEESAIRFVTLKPAKGEPWHRSSSDKDAALTSDLPDHALKARDVGTVVEILPHPTGGPRGIMLEVFTALGDSLAVVTVPGDAGRAAIRR